MRTGPDGEVTFELLDASAEFGHLIPVNKYLSGSFSVRSEITGGERLEVTVLDRLHHDGHAFNAEHARFSEHMDFDTGMLQVSADNGDTLVLDAANGDHETVRIEISTEGVTETLTQPWSLWREHLEFSDEFLGGL